MSFWQFVHLLNGNDERLIAEDRKYDFFSFFFFFFIELNPLSLSPTDSSNQALCPLLTGKKMKIMVKKAKKGKFFL